MTLKRIGESETDDRRRWSTGFGRREGEQNGSNKQRRNEWSVLTRTRVTFLDFLLARADAHAAARRSAGIQSAGRCVDVSRRTG